MNHLLYVWFLQDFDTGGEAVFGQEHLAMHEAERIVGNRAVSVNGDNEEMIYLYGPGDGTTRVMIRRWRRDDSFVKKMIENWGLTMPPLD